MLSPQENWSCLHVTETNFRNKYIILNENIFSCVLSQLEKVEKRGAELLIVNIVNNFIFINNTKYHYVTFWGLREGLFLKKCMQPFKTIRDNFSGLSIK